MRHLLLCAVLVSLIVGSSGCNDKKTSAASTGTMTGPRAGGAGGGAPPPPPPPPATTAMTGLFLVVERPR